MRNIDFWEGEAYGFEEKYNKDNNKDLPRLDSFLVEDGKKHSCMLILPGGGFDHLADHEGENIAEELNKAGISAFVLYYRVAPYTYPLNFLDAKRAFVHIKENAEKYHIDKLGVMGFSAGAFLSLALTEKYDMTFNTGNGSLDNTGYRPDVLGLCYPVISFEDESIWHKGSCENFFGAEKATKENRLSFSGELNVRDDMPPTFLWSTFEDKSVNCHNALFMASALKKKNIPFELHIFPDGRHGIDLATNVEGTNQWFDLYVNWLKRQGF
ncbi:MAG: alpha/beta hydrolase [Firmicutes bacterium]|nr:alpha/beta hydrolase [Bacillota bacterium]